MKLKESLASQESRDKNIEKMILSVSGWRKIFAENEDPESIQTLISPLDQELTAAVGAALAEYFQSTLDTPLLLLARDTRPTGDIICRIILQMMDAYHLKIKYLGITAIPQVLAYAKDAFQIGGFIYVSASHNPPGYNGFKFGGRDGRVLSANLNSQIKEDFISRYKSPEKMLETLADFNRVKTSFSIPSSLEIADNAMVSGKFYYELLLQVITGLTKGNGHILIKQLKDNLNLHKVSLAIDYNGSARIKSIDESILKDFHIKVYKINEIPGQFSHRILPEGDSLNELASFISRQTNKSLLFGYVPDCDGDRGNLLFYLGRDSKKIQQLDAQTTFALAVLSELSFIDLYFPQKLNHMAVAANGPTSLRVNMICEKFGVSLFSGEVGEANITALAEQKAKENYHIRILGEGSNGGNITLPGTVRDPLCTVFSVLKFLYLRHPDTKITLIQNAFKRLSLKIIPDQKPEEAMIALLNYLNRYSTTSSYEDEALIKINASSQKEFKKVYEEIFTLEYLKKQVELKRRFNISRYLIINYEGSTCRIGYGNRSGEEDGGFKILFQDINEHPVGFIWMRKSRTEPVFRIMADILGDKEDERFLLNWHRNIIEEADARSAM